MRIPPGGVIRSGLLGQESRRAMRISLQEASLSDRSRTAPRRYLTRFRSRAAVLFLHFLIAPGPLTAFVSRDFGVGRRFFLLTWTARIRLDSCACRPTVLSPFPVYPSRLLPMPSDRPPSLTLALNVSARRTSGASRPSPQERSRASTRGFFLYLYIQPFRPYAGTNLPRTR